MRIDTLGSLQRLTTIDLLPESKYAWENHGQEKDLLLYGVIHHNIPHCSILLLVQGLDVSRSGNQAQQSISFNTSATTKNA